MKIDLSEIEQLKWTYDKKALCARVEKNVEKMEHLKKEFEKEISEVRCMLIKQLDKEIEKILAG